MPVVMSIRGALGPIFKLLQKQVNPALFATACRNAPVLAVFRAKRNAAMARWKGVSRGFFPRPAGRRKAQAGDPPVYSRACGRFRLAGARFPRTGTRLPGR